MVVVNGIQLNFNFQWSVFKEKDSMPKQDLLFKMFQIFMAEFLGTMMLVFWGCASLGHLNTRDPIATCWLWGNVVFIDIQIFGPISYCHINPAVTLSFFIFGYVSVVMALVYCIAQNLGSIAGYALLMAFGTDELTVYGFLSENHLCVNIIATTPFRAMLMEAAGTAVLCFLVGRFCCPLNPNGMGNISFAFSLVITIIAYALAPLTGASINPARSFGPAVINNEFSDHWVFWVGPLSGSLLSSFLYHIFFIPIKNP